MKTKQIILLFEILNKYYILLDINPETIQVKNGDETNRFNISEDELFFLIELENMIEKLVINEENLILLNYKIQTIEIKFNQLLEDSKKNNYNKKIIENLTITQGFLNSLEKALNLINNQQKYINKFIN